ncbi:MAG: hypothetical protein ABH872_04865 [Candidatus Omnitrophota bacterium]
MKEKVVLLFAALAMFSGAATYASDWDTAGKILTGIAGLRILSGGKVDIIGSMTGVNQSQNNAQTTYYYYGGKPSRHGGTVYYRTYTTPTYEVYCHNCKRTYRGNINHKCKSHRNNNGYAYGHGYNRNDRCRH